MAVDEKTPLQSVTGVLCDALCELPLEDRQRALDIVILTLGIDRPSVDRAARQQGVLRLFRQLIDSLRQDQLIAIGMGLDEEQKVFLGKIAAELHALPEA
jgi:hypothetical protein